MSKVKLATLAVLVLAFVSFMASGFFFASDETLAVAEVIWLVALAAVVGLMLLRLAIATFKDTLIKPDENGNYPVSLLGFNYNLAGTSRRVRDKAWAGWQLTNNPAGGRSTAALLDGLQAGPEPPPGPWGGPAPTGFVEVTDPGHAPPILIDARAKVREL